MRASEQHPVVLAVFTVFLALFLTLSSALAPLPGSRAGEAWAQDVIQPEPSPFQDYLYGRDLASVLGVEVRSRQEENMGRIVDVLADRDGQVQAAVIEFGGFLGIGTRKIAVDWSALHFDLLQEQPVAVLDMTRDQVRLAPEYRANRPAMVLRAEAS